MSWKKVKLGEVLFHQESRFKPDDERISGLKRINKIDFSGKIYLSDSTSRTDMIVIRTGELVISGINVHKGAVAIYEGKEDITATIHYSSYKVKNEKLDLDFLKLFLKSPEFLDAIKEQVPGGIKTEIKPKHLLPLEVKLPDLSEQKDIVTSFFHFEKRQNSLINELSRQLDLVKKLRQQILQDAVQGKLVSQDADDEPAGILLEKIKAEKAQLIKAKKVKKDRLLSPIKAEEIPFEIPENWVWCRLGKIATNIEYGTSEKAEMGSKHVAVLRMNNIQDGKIDFEKLKYVKASIDDLPRLYLKEGDLLFNRTNSYELVGKSGVYRGDDDVMTFASYLIRVQFSKNTSSDFINYYINSSFCRITQLEPQIIQQNGQANFNGTKLKNVICPFPPLPEQHRIVAKIESLMRLCDDMEANIRQNQNYTGQLLQAALRDALQEGGP